MTTLLFVSLGLCTLALIGGAPVYLAFKNAATGYEDDQGFHLGVQSAPVMAVTAEKNRTLSTDHRVASARVASSAHSAAASSTQETPVHH